MTSWRLPVLLCLSMSWACQDVPEVALERAPKSAFNACLNPVVMVPGLGGSVLDYRHTDAWEPLHPICGGVKRNEWSSGINRAWPSIAGMFAEDLPDLGELRACNFHDLHLNFDRETKTFSNARGVDIRPRDFGGVQGISNLLEVNVMGVSVRPKQVDAFDGLITRLTKKHGFVVGENLLGAPYDFRWVADEGALKAYYGRLKQLVEDAHQRTSECPEGRRKVNLVSHSLGGPVTQYFLNSFVDDAWKQKYVREFVSVSSPWGGAGRAYRGLISGINNGLPGPASEFLPILLDNGGMAWMLPFTSVFGEREFVQIGKEKFSASAEDIARLFGGIAKRPDQVTIINELIRPRTQRVDPPGVPLHCIHGLGNPTETFYIYKDAQAITDQPKFSFTEGDGTVELTSLGYCGGWPQTKLKQFVGTEYGHISILRAKPFIDYAERLLVKQHPPVEMIPDDEPAAIRETAELIGGFIERTYPAGKRPARRGDHAKPHGCVRAKVTVPELPAHLREGVFREPRTYDAWIRYSNSNALPKPDTKRDGRGMAIKLMGVPGEKILRSERTADTQDFLMIDYPVFFVDTAAHYLDFEKDSRGNRTLDYFVGLENPLDWHLDAAKIAGSILAQKVVNPLQTRYWSMAPILFGDRAVKVSAKPCRVDKGYEETDSPNFLADNMARNLKTGEGCFELLVQFRTDPAKMPVENPMIEWSEADSPFEKVAHIEIPSQEFRGEKQQRFCENLSFTAWHALPEHRPLGGINRLRRVVYETSSRVRHAMNGVRPNEPTPATEP